MDEELLLNYMLRVFEYNETIYKCVNLGFNPDKLTSTEIELSKESQRYIKNIMKERKIKQWN
jgi:hypothetical protein